MEKLAVFREKERKIRIEGIFNTEASSRRGLNEENFRWELISLLSIEPDRFVADTGICIYPHAKRDFFFRKEIRGERFFFLILTERTGNRWLLGFSVTN